MSEMINIGYLHPHPRNNEFFDDMTGEKWDEFLESVRNGGVIEPIVVTPDGDGYTIVSGHQRTRACIELGIDEIECKVKEYDSDDEIIKDLIETNIRQRGSVGGSMLKLGRRIAELERIYGIRKGNNQHSTNGGNLKQEDLMEMLDIDKETLRRAKTLASLPTEIQQMVEDGKISASTASRVIASLSPSEQEQLISSLDATAKYTQKQIESQLSSIRGQLEEVKQDNDMLRDTNENIRRKYLELKDREPEVREVVPADYEDLKTTNASLIKKLDTVSKEALALEKQIRDYGADAEAYRKLKAEIEKLKTEQHSLVKKIEASGKIIDLLVKVEHMLEDDLSPMQFSSCMSELDYNPTIRDNANELIERVRNWCNSTYEAINKTEIIIE